MANYAEPIEISSDEDDFQPQTKVARSAADSTNNQSSRPGKVGAAATPKRISDLLRRPRKVPASAPRPAGANILADAPGESSENAPVVDSREPALPAEPQVTAQISDGPSQKEPPLRPGSHTSLPSRLKPAEMQPEWSESQDNEESEEAPGTMLASIMQIDGDANTLGMASSDVTQQNVNASEKTAPTTVPPAVGSKRKGGPGQSKPPPAAGSNRLERFKQKAKLESCPGSAPPAAALHGKSTPAQKPMLQSKLDKFKIKTSGKNPVAAKEGRQAVPATPTVEACTTEECRNRMIEGIGNVNQILKARTANELDQANKLALHVHQNKLKNLSRVASSALDVLQGIRDSTVVALGESHAGKSTLMNHMLERTLVTQQEYEKMLREDPQTTNSVETVAREELDDELDICTLEALSVSVEGNDSATNEVLWREEDLSNQGQEGLRRDYEGFMLPEASGGAGSTTSIPWEVSFGTGRPRIILAYTSAACVAKAQALLLEKHQEVAEDKLDEDTIPEEDRVVLHRALAMCGFGEDLGSKSLVQILKQKSCTQEACHIPSRFRALLGHAKVVTYNRPILNDALDTMRTTLNKETHNAVSSCWGLLEKVSIEVPCTILKGGRFVDAPGCADLDTLRTQYLKTALNQATIVLLVLTPKIVTNEVKDVLAKSSFLTRLLNGEARHRLIAVVPTDKEWYSDRDRYMNDTELWKEKEARLCNNKLGELESMLIKAAADQSSEANTVTRNQLAAKIVQPHIKGANKGWEIPDDNDDDETDSVVESSMEIPATGLAMIPVYPHWEKKHGLSEDRSNCRLLENCIQEMLGDAIKNVLAETGTNAVKNILQPFLCHVRQLLQIAQAGVGDKEKLARVCEGMQQLAEALPKDDRDVRALIRGWLPSFQTKCNDSLDQKNCSTSERFRENLRECAKELNKPKKTVLNGMCAVRRTKKGVMPSGRYMRKELGHLMVGQVLNGAIPAFEEALKQLWGEDGALKHFREKLEDVGRMPNQMYSPSKTNNTEDSQYNTILSWIASCQQLERTSFATSVMLKARGLFDPAILCPKAKLYHELEQKAEKLVTEAIMKARECTSEEDRETVLGEKCEEIACSLIEDFKKECITNMNKKAVGLDQVIVDAALEFKGVLEFYRPGKLEELLQGGVLSEAIQDYGLALVSTQDVIQALLGCMKGNGRLTQIVEDINNLGEDELAAYDLAQQMKKGKGWQHCEMKALVEGLQEEGLNEFPDKPTEESEVLHYDQMLSRVAEKIRHAKASAAAQPLRGNAKKPAKVLKPRQPKALWLQISTLKQALGNLAMAAEHYKNPLAEPVPRKVVGSGVQDVLKQLAENSTFVLEELLCSMERHWGKDKCLHGDSEHPDFEVAVSTDKECAQWRKRAALEVKRAKLLEVQPGKPKIAFTAQTVLLLVEHLALQFGDFCEAKSKLCRVEKPKKRKRAKLTLVSNTTGRSGIQDSLMNKQKKAEPAPPREATASEKQKLQEISGKLTALEDEKDDIHARLEDLDEHPEVCRVRDAIRKELVEEHNLNGEDLEEALANEMDPWIEDHEVRLKQIDKEQLQLERHMKRQGFDPIDVRLALEEVAERDDHVEVRPGQKKQRCVKSNFDHETFAEGHKFLNEGGKTEYLPEYAAPDGLNRNEIGDKQGGGKVGGGASGFIKRSKLLQDAGIQQEGDGWPSTNAVDTGLGNFSERYKIETPKQLSQLLEKLKQQQQSDDSDAPARQIGNDWEGSDRIEGLEEMDMADAAQKNAAKREQKQLTEEQKQLLEQPCYEDEGEVEEEDDDDECWECGDGSTDDMPDLVLCDTDGCDRAYHPGCLNPPLTIETLPEGEWFCPACMIANIPPDDMLD